MTRTIWLQTLQIPPKPRACADSGCSSARWRTSGCSVRARPRTWLPRAPAPAPSAPGAPPAAGSPEAQLAAQIEARFKDLKKSNHFQTLGLSRDATKDQVKTAFLALAKIFHPDRLPQSLSALAPKMSSVFEAIREAYDTLHDDQKRRTYVLASERAPVQAPVGPGGARNSVDAAAEAFKKGELHFRKREFALADAEFARALGLDKKAVYLAARGWAIFMDPNRKAEAPQAKQLMQDALKLDPRCDRAHYQLGVIARVENDIDRAERYFRDAVAANPKHLEANQELRLIEMRKKRR